MDLIVRPTLWAPRHLLQHGTHGARSLVVSARKLVLVSDGLCLRGNMRNAVLRIPTGIEPTPETTAIHDAQKNVSVQPTAATRRVQSHNPSRKMNSSGERARTAEGTARGRALRILYSLGMARQRTVLGWYSVRNTHLSLGQPAIRWWCSHRHTGAQPLTPAALSQNGPRKNGYGRYMHSTSIYIYIHTHTLSDADHQKNQPCSIKKNGRFRFFFQQ